MDKLATNKIFSNEMMEKTASWLSNKKSSSIRKRAFEFINTESNRDTYLCELLMRKIANKYKIKLTHYSGILDYAAFEAIWSFDTSQESVASRVFETLSYTLEGIKENYNRTMMPAGMLTPMIREAVKPVAESNQFKTNILSLDEGTKVGGEIDWREAIYGQKYPKLLENKIDYSYFQGDQADPPSIRKTYPSRGDKANRGG